MTKSKRVKSAKARPEPSAEAERLARIEERLGMWLVRFPPAGDIEAGWAKDLRLTVAVKDLEGPVPDWDGQLPASLVIPSNVDRFEGDGDPLSLLKLFVACVRSGVYPPVSAMERLEEAFAGFLASAGETTLDRLLNLDSPGKGKPSAVKRALMEARNDEAFVQMAVLVALGASMVQASVLVSEKFTRDGVHIPTGEALRKAYIACSWTKEFEQNSAVLQLADGDELETLLGTYDWTAYPGLKRKLFKSPI